MHTYLGKSKYGAVIDGIIKITFESANDNLHSAKWEWVKEL
jgi:hypothetical protein